MDKPLLRRQAMQRRDALEERERRSAAICAQVAALPAYAAARAMHCYLPMRSEVDTRSLIAGALAQGKGVVVPVVVRGANELAHAWLDTLAADALEPGSFGTWNPRQAREAAPGAWDLVIVPLLAFDRRGYRLGYGKGFYDRLLAAYPVPTIGVAFAAQELDALPAEAHDVRLEWIITEQETIHIQ
jgi:5-formyltetrahydrofolate cyclo-ligase